MSTIQTQQAAAVDSAATPDSPIWLGIVPSARIQAALNASLTTLAQDEDVVNTLQARGIAPEFIQAAVKSDLLRLAHALTVLTEHNATSVLASILPEHLQGALSGLEYRLDHVGREVLCPPDPLLRAWHLARETLGLGSPSGKGGAPRVREDLVFPSVQVVEAIRRDDPTVEAVTIAASFLATTTTSEPVYLELFFPGNRDGSAAQHARHMENRLSSLRFDPHRLVPPRLPICHLSVEVKDRQLLEDIHQIAKKDVSGLVKPYADAISVNPGDGSHNTKMAVRAGSHPSTPVNVLEFIYFDSDC